MADETLTEVLAEWAVFGERDRGHGLLAASGDLDFARRLTQFTDRPGDPPVGLEWGPIDSGFTLDGYYVFLRIFPDHAAGRAGMVRSYAVFVDFQTVRSIENLDGVFSKLPNRIVDLEQNIVPVRLHLGQPNLIPAEGQLEIAERLFSPKPLFPIVISHDSNSYAIINAVWGLLPKNLRTEFSFSFQFAPEHRIPSNPTFVVTNRTLLPRWNSSCILGGHSEIRTPEIFSKELSLCAQFQQFKYITAEYDIELQSISDLHLVVRFSEAVKHMESITFRDSLRALRILERFPETELSRRNSKRSELVKAVKSLAENNNSDEFLLIRNLNESSNTTLTELLQSTFRIKLDTRSFSDEVMSKILTCLEREERTWWHRCLDEWIEQSITHASDNGADTIWYLAKFGDFPLFTKLNILRLGDWESELCKKLPLNVTPPQYAAMLALARTMNWPKLHGIILANSCSDAAVAIQEHSKVSDPKGIGYHAILKSLGLASFMDAVVATNNVSARDFIVGEVSNHLNEIRTFLPGRAASWISIIAPGIRSINLRALDEDNLITTDLVKLFISSYSEESRDALMEIFQDNLLLLLTNFDSWWPIISTDLIMTEWITSQFSILLKSQAINGAPFECRFPVEIVETETMKAAMKLNPPERMVEFGISLISQAHSFSDDDMSDWLIDVFTKTSRTGLTVNDCNDIGNILLSRNYPNSARIIIDTVHQFDRNDVMPLFRAIVYKYTRDRGSNSVETNMKIHVPTVLIVTAIPIERSAVLKCLDETEYDYDLMADVSYWPKDSPLFKIHLVCTGMGNIDAFGATTHAAIKVCPSLAFLVGIAGGIKDSDIGDVIYSTKVSYYEGGKESAVDVLSRPVTEQTCKKLVQLALRVSDKKWQPENGDFPAPKATPAVVTSGEKVLTSKSKRAKNYSKVRTSFNDSQIVDMESFGFMKACRENSVPHYMVIRGVSDLVEGKTGEADVNNQPMAATNAASFLFKMLHDCPAALKIGKQKKRRK